MQRRDFLHDGITQATFEPQSGYLLARRACQTVFQALQASGGKVITGKTMPGPIRDGRVQSVRLTDGQEIVADDFLFACGPWLPDLFPELLGPLLSTSRPEVYYFGAPPGDRAHDEPALPVWADFGPSLWYGIPGSERRGFKIADDTHGPEIDPERAQRIPSAEGIEAAREYIIQRFPGMADAPLVDARVCQYTNTGNGDFIVDRHPEAANLWLAGGGSGHGFKHGPALGELLDLGGIAQVRRQQHAGVRKALIERDRTAQRAGVAADQDVAVGIAGDRSQIESVETDRGGQIQQGEIVLEALVAHQEDLVLAERHGGPFGGERVGEQVEHFLPVEAVCGDFLVDWQAAATRIAT